MELPAETSTRLFNVDSVVEILMTVDCPKAPPPIFANVIFGLSPSKKESGVPLKFFITGPIPVP